ncbi:hypothetical protein KFK09_004420 [Dendrobium nobile]|uniref:Uncharacterized protein n=1 Tax=Dendrobium nobile TaxID=94219 RepID=A0A8T3C419_DENNO|nr:hypothetical protein KFK09_004420 [Dendrobium nobile]
MPLIRQQNCRQSTRHQIQTARLRFRRHRGVRRRRLLQRDAEMAMYGVGEVRRWKDLR